MIVSIAWLSELLGRELDAHDVAHRLAMLGAPVEAIEELNRDLDDVIVGLVEKVERHPNADRLTLCHVNDGAKVWEVVCGAPNVRDGAKYPYAPTGATLPGGLKLSARKIRGVVSNGMLCSAQELGLGTDSDGIMELLTDAAPGTRLVDVMPMADTRLDVEVTANRPDLLGHRGVARELAAVYDVPVKLPVLHNAPSDSQPVRRVEQAGSVDGIEVRIDDRDTNIIVARIADCRVIDVSTAPGLRLSNGFAHQLRRATTPAPRCGSFDEPFQLMTAMTFILNRAAPSAACAC